jgi:hypothetical protein
MVLDGDDNGFSGTLSDDDGITSFKVEKTTTGMSIFINTNFQDTERVFDAMMRLRTLIDKEYEASVQ